MRGVTRLDPFLQLAGKRLRWGALLAQNDYGFEHLAANLVRDSDHSAFADGWMRKQNRLNFNRTNSIPRHEDDIIVPVVHCTKDNKEMSSVALDEHTRIGRLG